MRSKVSPGQKTDGAQFLQRHAQAGRYIHIFNRGHFQFLVLAFSIQDRHTKVTPRKSKNTYQTPHKASITLKVASCEQSAKDREKVEMFGDKRTGWVM